MRPTGLPRLAADRKHRWLPAALCGCIPSTADRARGPDPAGGVLGPSLQIGIWNPWTLLVTYWLYFAHFFFLTTLAVSTRRTSLWSLSLWGVLFGLYESWITKVIWAGYGADGKLILGRIGRTGSASSAWCSSSTRSCPS